MPLNEKQTRHLKALAHHLKPVVTVGQAGLHEGVLREIDTALEHHELIKVKINVADRDERQRILAEIALRSAANPITSIGSLPVFYRANPKRKTPIALPDGGYS